MSHQSTIALRKANDTRLRQGRVLRSLGALPRREGFGRAADLLRAPSDLVARMTVGQFLGAIRRTGPAYAERLVAKAGFIPATINWRVGPGRFSDSSRQLTPRQRSQLAAVLEERAR